MSPTKIYVPVESVEAYKLAPNWSVYADIIQAAPIPVPEAVDLGLSVKWASFNLGATSLEEYGDYYAWGETEVKDVYSLDTYKWHNNSSTSLYFKYDGEDKFILDPEDDVARIKLGGDWHIPTYDEFRELDAYCSKKWITMNGIRGVLFTGRNGKTIFFPAGGFRHREWVSNAGIEGRYWANEIELFYWMPTYDDYIGLNYEGAYYGLSI